MFLSEYIKLGSREFSTMRLILMLGFIYWIFVSWYEAKKDGFDSERHFDLLFMSSLVSCLAFSWGANFFKWVFTYYPNSFLLALDPEIVTLFFVLTFSFVPAVIFSKIWKWSIYRLLDIYALSDGLLLFILSLGKFLITTNFQYFYVALLTLLLYVFVLRFRGHKFFSGFVFSVFMAFLGTIGFLIFRGGLNLPFYILLFIIGLVNLVSRRNKMIIKKNLPAEFVKEIKKKLLKKDKELADDQIDLMSEDPYLATDRTSGNSENMDEAILEDYSKTVVDARMNIINRMRLQIKKALAAIHIGNYGTCEKCGKPIDKARLEVFPETPICYNCAQEEHQKESII